MSNVTHSDPTALDQFMFKQQKLGIGGFVIPASGFLKIKDAIQGRNDVDEHKWRSAQDHAASVERIAQQVKDWDQLPGENRPPLRTNRSPMSSFALRHSNKEGAHTVDVHDLNHILHLDEDAGTITIEPLVTVGQVTSALLPHGLMLEATLEMEEATLGGLALSQGLTTHSHRCGWVHDTVTEWEYVTGTGEVITATEHDNSDVFALSGMSQGALGFLTSLTLRVVPAARETLLTYEHVDSFEKLADRMTTLMQESNGGKDFFLEAIVFSKNHAVIVRGDNLTEDEVQQALARGVKRNHLGQWHQRWFFTQVQDTTDGQQQLMPMRDYLMRHDRCMCMTMKYTFPPANSALFRYTMGWAMPPRQDTIKTIQTPAIRELVVRNQVYQDIAVPADRYAELLHRTDEAFGNYPLLVYPSLWRDKGGLQRHPEGTRGTPTEPNDAYYLNIGIYGPPPKADSNTSIVQQVRGLLAWARDAGGYEHTYCDVLQTREEFNDQLDVESLKLTRKRIGSDQLPEPYDKARCELPWETW